MPLEYLTRKYIYKPSSKLYRLLIVTEGLPTLLLVYEPLCAVPPCPEGERVEVIANALDKVSNIKMHTRSNATIRFIRKPPSLLSERSSKVTWSSI